MMNWKQRLAIAAGCIAVAFVLPVSPADEAVPEKLTAAQAPPSADAAADLAQTQSGEDDSILSLIKNSGTTGWLFMGALGLFSLYGVSVAIERLVNTRQSIIIPDSFIGAIREVMSNNRSKPGDLGKVCDEHDVAAARILLAGVDRAGRPLPEVEKAMEDAAAREIGELRSRVRPLNVAGSIAPLLGLLGTVVGMIIAFRTASQSGLGKGELLAQGIYMALITTAAGLSIAIPALLSAAFFNGKIERYFRRVDEVLMSTVPLFTRVEKPIPVVPKSESSTPESERLMMR